ncbi:hypothetical protein ANCCAN_17788, partial [Ancylostoma caninum]
EWSCDLERKAISALKSCPSQSVSVPVGTTGFFYYRNHSTGGDPMDMWLSEINNTSIDLHEHPEAPVRCRGKNRNYCNLVRYDASRIGCAENQCNGKKSTFCLTNRPPLLDEDVLYYWGEGACPTGKCRPPTYGCNIDTGLCFEPVPTTTTTTTAKSIICHPLGCFGYPF